MTKLALKLIAKNKKTKDPFLDLGNCGLRNFLPKELGDCVWLKRLNLGDNYRDEISQKRIKSKNRAKCNSFFTNALYISEKLVGLQSLDLSGNQISNIGFSEKLVNLQSLDLSRNQISDITFLEKLTSLQLLNLSGNQISNINFSEKLVDLQSLDLSSNQISNISFSEKLVGLQSLDLSSNQISNISFSEKLVGLQSLNLSNNQISDIHFLSNLTTLLILDLTRNLISNISFLEGLENLQVLILDNNKIIDINFEMGFRKLRLLSIVGNEIYSLNFLNKLDNLQILDINRNQISDIRFLEKYHKLQYLNISNNNLISNTQDLINIPVLFNLSTPLIVDEGTLDKQFILSFYEKLYTKYELKIIKNYFVSEQIYEGAAIVRDLEKITLEINSTSKLSNFVINLLFEKIYQVKQIISPPLEIVKQGYDAIIRHFERLEQQGEDYIFEAKVTLVGDGGAGKTSLQKRILDENAELPTGDDRTRGIKVYDWEFIEKNDTKYIAHIWDFGGQDVYYPVHRFFLTENSVYVLMASTRYTNHNFEYWIPTIYQFGGQSPIVLVQNCDNGNQKNWEDISVYYGIPDYNLCKPFYRINLKTDDNWGLKQLKASIEQQIVNLPHIGKAVPKSWVRVREVLIEEAEKNDCISFEKFTYLCKKVDKKAFDEAVDIEDLGKFLHDLGIILWYYYKDLLKNLVILKPEWAMNAVYQVIDDTIIQEQYGIIHKADFERIWHESTYRNKITELKLMLEVFKIAFPKKHQKEDFIIPARLLPITDENRWKDTEQYLRLEYHFDFMPKGIINQISAELSKVIASDNYVWNNAVIFRNDGSEAQVIEEHHFRRIFIKAKGRDARGLMLLIMTSINNVISEYRGVIPSIRVPCSCLECKTSSKPTIFQYEQLTELLTNNREYITCNKSDTKHKIDDLLYSAGFENIDSSKIIIMDKKSISAFKENTPEIFFSYAWDKAGDTESREKIVSELYQSLNDDGFNVIIDKEDLSYRESISEFMGRIGDGDIIVVALSDAYLKSINCMYEFYEIYKNSKQNRTLMRERIFPIRVESLNLSKPSVLDEYFEHWGNLENEWEELIKKRSNRIGESQQRKYKRIKAIASELGDFLDFLSDINSKTKDELSKDNFAEIKKAIEKSTKQ